MAHPATTRAPDLALIVADGDVPPLSELAPQLGPDALDDALVICADGGLRKARLIGLAPDLVIGDGDSLGPQLLAELRDTDIEVRLHPADKDESDTQLALLEAVRRGARHIVVLGALGGVRFDHSLANVLLLALPELSGSEVTLLDATTAVRVLDGAGRRSLTVDGAPGDIVSLLPLTEMVTGARTTGLRYALDGEALQQGPARGLSNEMTAGRADIAIESGRLAVVHTRSGGTR